MFFTNLQLSKNVLKVDPNIKNNDGWAPLHLCVRHSKEEALKNLLEVENIDPDVKGGNYGFSPLHLAVMQHSISMVKILYDSGANIFQRNHLNRVPR